MIVDPFAGVVRSAAERLAAPADWVPKSYGVGVPVYGPPQAGDLVFYNEYGDGISHVAIATGRGTIIHASSYAGYVTESPIDAPAGRLPEARRVL